MADVKQPHFFQTVEGLQVLAIFSAENIRSAIHYHPHPDEIILVSYPKCGTTWSQYMLSLIFRKGVPMKSSAENFGISPYLEMCGADGMRHMPRPGVIKTHLPFHLKPYSPDAKYIYVARNPKDCCVSYFYHSINFRGPDYGQSFDVFFELFMSGQCGYGDYFDHLLDWYEHRNDPNILFVTYEEMKVDAKAAVMKFASFLGKEYVDLLNENPKILEDILHYSSFGYMKENVVDDFDQIVRMDEESVRKNPYIPDGMKPTLLKIIETKREVNGEKLGKCFVRKGIVGDWRNHFSPEQNKRMNEKISQKLKGSELLDLWRDCI